MSVKSLHIIPGCVSRLGNAAGLKSIMPGEEGYLSTMRRRQRRQHVRALLVAGALSAGLHASLLLADYIFNKPSSSAKASGIEKASMMEFSFSGAEQTPGEDSEAADENPARLAWSDYTPVDFKPESASDSTPLSFVFDLSSLLVPAGAHTGESHLASVSAQAGAGIGAYLSARPFVFQLGDLDQMPLVQFQPLPHYPPDLLRTKVTGEVLVSFIVDASGRVHEPVVVSSDRAEFENPALDAIKRWRFAPGKKEGRPVATRMEVPIVFDIFRS